MEHLCKCLNCESILIDKNPQTNAQLFEPTGEEKEMIRINDESGEFWACPICKTDGHLIDLNYKNYNSNQQHDKDFWEYTPELSETHYTEKDFMEIAKGNREYAIRLRHAVTWQHPETVVDEDLREGEIVEVNGTYKMIDNP